MLNTSIFSRRLHRTLPRLGALVLLCLLNTLWVPQAQAQNPCNAIGSQVGFQVQVLGCTYATSGASNVNNLTVNVPTNNPVLLNDYLVAVLMEADNHTFAPVSGWTLETQYNTGNNNVGVAVYTRTATGADAASYNFTWSNTAQARGFMVHLRGTSGLAQISPNQNNGGSTTATANGVTAGANDLVLRLLGTEDTPTVTFPGGGHAALLETPNGGTLKAAATYIRGSSASADFTLSPAATWLTASLRFPPGTPPFLCPGVDDSVVGTQRVVLNACTETKVTSNQGSVTISTPGTAVVGDLLVAVINTDDNETVTAPGGGGWTTVDMNDAGGAGPTLGVFKKFATLADLGASHVFSIGTTEQFYAYMLNFRGASGQTLFSGANGNSSAPTSPALGAPTTVADTLMLRVSAADQGNVTADPPTIVSGQRNITADASVVNDGNAVTGQAVYVSQQALGNGGTVAFSLTASRAWRAATIGVEPIEFRFSMPDTVSSTCGTQAVTLQVTDRLGNPMTWFTGTVTLSTSTGGAGDWYNPGSLTGTLDNGTANDGIATYTFAAADAGVATFNFQRGTTGALNFNLTYGVWTENASFDPTLTIDNQCRFHIIHDGNAGTCASEPVTVTLFDSAGQPGTFFTGQIDISNAPTNLGDYIVNTGAGTFSNGTANDGAASYTFAAADNGSVIFDFSLTTATTTNFNIVAAGFPTYTVDGGFDPNLVVAGCELRLVIPDTTRDVCSLTNVTLQAVDTLGNLITSFNGSVVLSSSAGAGTWSIVSANGSIGSSVGGTATYTFDASDGGDVDLGYRLTSTNASVNFNATAANFTSPSGSYDPNVEIVGCTVLITQSGGGTLNACSSAGINITYTIRDRDAATATGFTGTLALTATGTPNHGNWISTTGSGTLTNGAPDDGVATYQFVSADAGVAVIKFTNNHAQSLTLGATTTAITVSGGSQTALTVLSCTFRVTHGGTTDVCSIAPITIAVADSGGNPVTDYVGTVNLSTSTGHGTWSNNTGNGSVVDPFAGDGSATYNFVSGDNGSVSLNFRSNYVETININVSDGASTDPSNPMDTYDQNLVVQGCTFRISHAGEVSACSVTPVSIAVHDRNGAIATNFLGTVNISTSTLNGNWSVNTGAGTLTETPGDDNGVASYQFVGGDAGQVILDYGAAHLQTTNFDLVSNSIVEDGAHDPNLSITGCSPSVNNFACTTSGSLNFTVSAQNSDPALRSRMVVMMIFYQGSVDVTSASFNSQAMTRIHQEKNSGGNQATADMWGILDTNLPAGAGSYSGTYTGGNNTPAMCLVEIINVGQSFPAYNMGSPTGGQVNGSQDVNPPDGAMATTITVNANNSLVISGGVNDRGNGGGGRAIDGTDPSPPMSFLDNNILPNSATASMSSGIKATTGLFTVTDTDNSTPNAYAHIVAAFAPLIAGPPIVEGYVPVHLYKSFSGNVNFRSIGKTLRRSSNGNPDGGAGATGCQFVPFATGTEATLSLPPSTTIEYAYLYWAGSGETADIDSDVDFGPTGSESSISADEVFQVDNVGGSGTLDYFLGLKDVTALVTSTGNYTLKNLTVQTGSPWNLTQACVGGWGLVVVFSNPDERLRTVNMFHGFQPFQNSSFSAVLSNFRIATVDATNYLPNAKFGHITIEGDETIGGNAESLSVQDAPGSGTFTDLPNSFNPLNSEFNSTVTRPIFAYDGVTSKYEFQPTAGINSDGYEIDFPGADALLAGRSGSEIGQSWGFDIDTHYIAGSGASDPLYPFAQPGAEEEQVTVRYSSGQDLVMLISEVVAISNFAIADMEIDKSVTSSFVVGGTGTYQLNVTNNGDNTPGGGYADGLVIVADTLPTGMTLANAGDVSGTNWACDVTLNPGAFTCVYDITNDYAGGQLLATQTLPPLNVTVQIGNATFFPNLDNNVKNVARMTHVGDAGCMSPFVPGLIPDPGDCARSPQYDNIFDLQNGSVDINNVNDKDPLTNNNVDSVTHIVKGVETDLGISKAVNGILETGSTGSYTLTVVNNGPDATTATITVVDTQPAGVSFDSASGTGWSCTTTPNMNCTYAASLAYLQQAQITLNVTVTGAEGENVTNTAVVSTGPFNFDINPANDADTDITAIVAPPVASQERFLMSVSAAGNDTSLGDITPISNFQNHDYIIYDPLIDKGSMFFDNSDLGFSVNDADAVHLFKNGNIAISAASSSTVGSNALAFEPEDIVRYDTILGTASMLFDGSAIFDGPVTVNHNIDAVYVRDDGRIVFSTAGPASITFSGPTTVNFNQGDIVEYDPMDGSATILIDASDSDIFGGEVQVDALYIRVDDTDPDLNKDIYILSVADASATLGACAGCDPVGGTDVTRDDIIELDDSGMDPVTQLLFAGDQPLGVFTPADPARSIDALHVVEDAYIGHFAISQFQAGNVCTPAQVRIRKHRGLTHNTDLDYFGSIKITADTAAGDWSVATGNGTLDNGTADDGEAIYTFVPSDNGVVTLYFTETTSGTTVNFDVTNGFASESGAEDPNFTFNEQITAVTFRDEFTTAAFDNHDGSTFWETDWVEVDDVAPGAASGNIVISGGVLAMTSTPATVNPPSMTRTVDLTNFLLTENIYLNFDYSFASLNSTGDAIAVQVSYDGTEPNFTTVAVLTGASFSGSNPVPQSYPSIDITGTLGGMYTASMAVRFVITQGYTGTSVMYLDNVEVSTGTTDCGIGSIAHYEVRIENLTGPSSTLIPGIACLGSVVTITGHDASHFPAASDEVLTLRGYVGALATTRGKWSKISGLGSFDGLVAGNGVATYDFPPGESQATFLYQYTGPTTDPQNVNFNMDSAYPIDANEDPTLEVRQAGLLFYNEGFLPSGTSVNSIATQIAGKPSASGFGAQSLSLEAVRTSDQDPLACAPLFDDGNTVQIEFGAECSNPGSCQTNSMDINGNSSVPVTNDNAGPGASSYSAPVSVLFHNQPNSGHPAGDINFTYNDVGEIRLHARYPIPFESNGSPSGDYMYGESNTFVVRPFGFSIDFSDDRTNAVNDSVAADHTSAPFFTAGEQFNATVRAVVWQPADDAVPDGVPDTGANLYDNAVTPNFGNETTNPATDYQVRVNLASVAAPANGLGTLTGNLFDTFANGLQTRSMVFDEVGIIHLNAELLTNDGMLNPQTYLSSNDGLYGNARNVGRFIPDHFQIESVTLQPRVQAKASAMCLAPPAATDFNYLGEAIQVSADITARNFLGAITHNYVGNYAKLGDGDFAASTFHAFEEIDMAPDADYSSRITLGTTPPAMTWEADPQTMGGNGVLAGNLILNRQGSGAEEAPLANIEFGLNTTDDPVDLVGFALDLDLDEVMPLANDVARFGSGAEVEFRYGRLIIDNAFGPETEPLNIPFRIEYYDGTQFVVNTADSCTSLLYEVDTPPAALDFVPMSYTGNLDDGETLLEDGEVSDVEISIFHGQTAFQAEGIDQDKDRPFITSAPGEGNEGSVLIELDLDHVSLPYSLDFLSYDWRTPGDLEVDTEDMDYSDNPRGKLDFGTYRGHDRIINWQEIFTGN